MIKCGDAFSIRIASSTKQRPIGRLCLLQRQSGCKYTKWQSLASGNSSPVRSIMSIFMDTTSIFKSNGYRTVAHSSLLLAYTYRQLNHRALHDSMGLARVAYKALTKAYCMIPFKLVETKICQKPRPLRTYQRSWNAQSLSVEIYTTPIP